MAAVDGGGAGSPRNGPESDEGKMVEHREVPQESRLARDGTTPYSVLVGSVTRYQAGPGGPQRCSNSRYQGTYGVDSIRNSRPETGKKEGSDRAAVGSA